MVTVTIQYMTRPNIKDTEQPLTCQTTCQATKLCPGETGKAIVEVCTQRHIPRALKEALPRMADTEKQPFVEEEGRCVGD